MVVYVYLVLFLLNFNMSLISLFLQKTSVLLNNQAVTNASRDDVNRDQERG